MAERFAVGSQCYLYVKMKIEKKQEILSGEDYLSHKFKDVRTRMAVFRLFSQGLGDIPKCLLIRPQSRAE
jgi:hypothetical protein